MSEKKSSDQHQQQQQQQQREHDQSSSAPNVSELLKLVSSHPLFSRLSNAEQKSFASSLAATPPQSYTPGTIIVNLNTNSTPYLVVRGSVSLHQGRSLKEAEGRKSNQQLTTGDIISFSLLVAHSPWIHSPSSINIGSHHSHHHVIAKAGSHDSEETVYLIPLTPAQFSPVLPLIKEIHTDDYSWSLDTGCLSTGSNDNEEENVGSGSHDAKVKVAFYDAKPYMVDAFNSVLKQRAVDDSLTIKFRYLEPRLDKSTASLARGCSCVCAFVNDSVDATIAGILAKLGIKMIAIRAAGFNNVDLKACDKLGITVARVPAYSPYAVAEFATALLLALNRKTHHAYNRIRDYNFTLNRLVGHDMHGKTVGVFGTGKIGICFIRIMLGFGCQVICYDVYQNEEVKKMKNVKYVEMEQVFKESDYISLHLPLTKETTHLINKKTLALMKTTAILINTGRGQLVNAHDLLHSLKHSQLGGAGLDVYEEEEQYFFEDYSEMPMKDEILLQLINQPNVLVTSHQAFLTAEALQGIAETTVNNIKEFFIEGKKLGELTNSLNSKGKKEGKDGEGPAAGAKKEKKSKKENDKDESAEKTDTSDGQGNEKEDPVKSKKPRGSITTAAASGTISSTNHFSENKRTFFTSAG